MCINFFKYFKRCDTECTIVLQISIRRERLSTVYNVLGSPCIWQHCYLNVSWLVISYVFYAVRQVKTEYFRTSESGMCYVGSVSQAAGWGVDQLLSVTTFYHRTIDSLSLSLFLRPFTIFHAVYIHIYVYEDMLSHSTPLHTLPFCRYNLLLPLFPNPGSRVAVGQQLYVGQTLRPIAALHSRHVVLLLSSAVSGPRPAHSTAARFTVCTTVSLWNILNRVKWKYNDTRR